MGGPGETKQSAEESLAFADALRLDTLSLNAGLRIYPHTALSRIAVQEGLISADGEVKVAVCPIGFVTDHMETLFDLDTVAAQKAADAGVAFVRAPVPNDDELVVSALAEAVAKLV